MTDIVERLRADAEMSRDCSSNWEAFDCSEAMREAAAEIESLRLSLSEAHATGRREGLSEAAKWHDDECHRLHQQIKENLRYMSTHGLRGSDANDSCREEIITHKISAAAIRAAMEKEE
jgi:hypothetical protein